MADTLPLKGIDLKILRDRLASWDTKHDPKAPLTSRQKDFFIDLTSHASERPFPEELPAEDVLSIIPQKSPPSSPGVGTAGRHFIQESLETTGKIENAQQFFSWFAEVEEEIENEEDLPYRCHLEELNGYQQQCDTVLEEVSLALNYLVNLNQQYVNVSTKTNALHEACEHLLEEQTRLMNTAESISNKLSYFNELDSISSKLGSPTLAVTNESFVPMLSRLDECIHYIKSNPRYKESDVFLARFKQCLSRALNLIKSHVVSILQNATQQIQPKKDSQGAGDNAFTLFYGKFRANAPRVKALMEQLEQRVDKSPDYQQILSDCHQCYFAQRELLLGPSIASTIADLAAKHVRDHCSLMRSGCAFMVHVCVDEYQLYLNFFSRSTPLLDEMLEKLCTHLYDMLRPLIIHVNHLETLAELCSILKLEMLEEHVQHNSQELKAFETICKQMLMDVQERLVYRTYIYIKSDILNYSAAQGDLAYPEKLEMMESIAESVKKGQIKTHSRTPSNASSTSQEVARLTSENGSNLTTTMPMSPADLHGMWYPTVRRTLVTLSKLYRCIDKTTFQGLSQEALQSCIASLINAMEGIAKRKTSLDGQLFMIKHLLILREQIAPFHADFSIRETSLDFSRFKDAAYGLMSRKSHLFSLNSSNSILQLLLEASVIISMMSEEEIKQVTLRQQPFATPEKVHDNMAETYKFMKTKLVVVRRSMSLYLANRDTEMILFKPIKVNIQQRFQQVVAILTEHYTEEDRQIVACPSLEQLFLSENLCSCW
ncbi:hypothetical protein ACJMK2_019255 [Sinanodonta woodiana]|uniref:Conserved oligomeric Golgi complex subunit 3 n=1 Tax=Sinanodonta woodiana TaxID=1069815 RepID=A0ABD3UHA8_SINWO